MSAAEIIENLSSLSSEELSLVHDRILKLEEALFIEPGAELSEAIDEGLESMKNEPLTSLDDAKEKIAEWSGRSG